MMEALKVSRGYDGTVKITLRDASPDPLVASATPSRNARNLLTTRHGAIPPAGARGILIALSRVLRALDKKRKSDQSTCRNI